MQVYVKGLEVTKQARYIVDVKDFILKDVPLNTKPSMKAHWLCLQSAIS